MSDNLQSGSHSHLAPKTLNDYSPNVKNTSRTTIQPKIMTAMSVLYRDADALSSVHSVYIRYFFRISRNDFSSACQSFLSLSSDEPVIIAWRIDEVPDK